jgi:haloacetate dehalogenase
MLPNFQQQAIAHRAAAKPIATSKIKINVWTGGKGFPLLLLHGYPQTYLMWHKIAPRLAENFTVVATDLRGYGDSDKPQGDSQHDNYSKRTMARDQVEVMSQLGYQEFYLVGHDRGARVARRLTLDYPEKVKKLALLDILPTYDLYQNTDKEFATAYYHWFFLIQPYPLPETLIGANPEYFLQACLKTWSKDFSAFTPQILAEYIRCFSDASTIHATCEDYRAAASIDLIHDESDINLKIKCPVLVLWGSQGILGRKYNFVSNWRQNAIDVKGMGIDCGHFLAEEKPDETYFAIRDFLSS